ncbi:MAG: chromosome partitioning protein [Actinobacteria bacterium]|nr:chromosome partitioning protein [Actinomycetota bacterium]
MGLICFGSVRSSPGVTATVLAVGASWPTTPAPVVVEADPDGGVLAARYSLGRSGESPGLTSLATAARRGLGAGELWRHTQELPGGMGVVVGPDGADSVIAALRSAGQEVGTWLAAQPDVVALADCGRLRPGSPALDLVRCATRLVVVVRPRVEELQALAQRVAALAQLAPLGLVLVGERPYGPAEVGEHLGVEVLGVVADDPRGAQALEGGASVRVLRRSPLARSALALAGRLVPSPQVPMESEQPPWPTQEGLRAGSLTETLGAKRP